MSSPDDSVFASFPILDTERLVLRESRPADTAAVYAVLSAESVTRFYNLSPLKSAAEAEALIARRAAAWQRRERIRWAVARREDDVVIGSCGYSSWDRQAARAEIGYELAPEWQGKGLMREALESVLAFGFGPMALNRVEAFVVPENEASLRLLHRLGFQDEGLMRERGFWKSRFHDLRMLSLLKRDFRE